MVVGLLGGVVGLGAAGALAKLAGKMPRALADTRLTTLNIGTARAVALPAYGEYTYEKKNEQDSTWWLFYGRDEESGYDGYTLTLKDAKITDYAGPEGIYADGDLHIRLLGINEIGWGAKDYPACAVCFGGDLLITGAGILKVAAKESAAAGTRGNLFLYGNMQLEGKEAIRLDEGKCYFEAGTVELAGKVKLAEMQTGTGVEVLAAKDPAGRYLDQPQLRYNTFYARGGEIHTVKIGDTVETPVFSPEPGSEVEAGEEIAIISPTWGAQITYSTDGSDPFAAGQPYEAPVSAREGLQLKAGASLKGLKNSPVAEASYAVRRHTLTWMLGDEKLAEASLCCQDAITAPEVPEKEGHSFAGWNMAPEVMPAEDLTVKGRYKPNRYTFTCMLEGQVYARESYVYGTSVKQPASPARFGNSFSGWGEIPAKMPAQDVTLKGRFVPKRFRFCCLLDGEVYAADQYGYGSSVKTPASPAKIGYDFSGWGEIPKKMPAEDVTLSGTFIVHEHTLTYILDGDVIQTETLPFGAPLTLLPAPEKEGHTFSGWSRLPSTMPDENVTVSGSFTVKTYQVTWLVNGTVYAQASVQYGEALPVQTKPEQEGHTFAGWDDQPEVMPAENLTLAATLTPNKYILAAWIGDALYAKDSYVYGTSVKVPASPAKTGYVFSGWGEVPAKMPAQDVTLKGNWSRRKYRFSCILEGKTYASDLYPYEGKIKSPANPARIGYTFSGWSAIPATMPSADVEVTGSFAVNSYQVTYKVDGEVYKEETAAYGAAIKPAEAPDKESDV